MAIVSVSIPSEINQKIIELAKIRRGSKSQIVAEAIEKYDFDLRWAEIRRYGDRIAKELGIESDDDVERIFGRKAKNSR